MGYSRNPCLVSCVRELSPRQQNHTTLNPKPSTPQPSSTLNPNPPKQTLSWANSEEQEASTKVPNANPQPQTPKPKPQNPKPKAQAPSPKTQTPNPKPQSLSRHTTTASCSDARRESQPLRTPSGTHPKPEVGQQGNATGYSFHSFRGRQMRKQLYSLSSTTLPPSGYPRLPSVDGGSTFALRRSTLDVCLGG